MSGAEGEDVFRYFLPTGIPANRNLSGSCSQLFTGELVVHQAAVTKFQFQHTALPTKFVFTDQIEAERELAIFLADRPGVVSSGNDQPAIRQVRHHHWTK